MTSLWAQYRANALWDEWSTNGRKHGLLLVEYIAEAIDAAERYGYNRALDTTPNAERDNG